VPRLVGTSGTIESLATIHARGSGIVPSPLTGYELSLKDLRVDPPLEAELFRTCRDSRDVRAAVGNYTGWGCDFTEAMTLLRVESLTV